MIPQSVIDDIRQRADIAEIISDYVQLNPSGRNFKALSPFTQEKTPSFIVSPDKQIYKCFSTGKGGNVFTFVMEMEKVSFPEAVELVAKRTGIDISRFTAKETPAGKAEESGTAALRWAARLFQHTLFGNAGKKGLAYLAGERALTPETITAFGLGFAPDSWDYLLQEAHRAGINEKLLAELGLIAVNKQKNSRYDAFRNRVIFPILSVGGQVVGFGGRTLRNDSDTPKYLNSPESRIFEKSKLLYGLHTAKQEIRRTEIAILVEGYMDVLALHQAGVTSAVASCGTALTRHQAKTLHKYTSTVLFIYDADPAGKKSMMGGIDILLAEGITPYVVMLPPGDDPDSFVRREGRQGFLQYADVNRLSFIDFQLRYFRDSGTLDQPDTRAGAIQAIARTISIIPDRIRREIYLQELSAKLRISMQALQEFIVHTESRQQFRQERKASVPEKIEQKPQGSERLTVPEKTFLKALLESTMYGNAVLEFAASHEEILELQHPAAREILVHMVRRYRQDSNNPDALIDPATEISMFATAEARNLAAGLLIDQPVSDRWQEQPEAEREHARRCLMAFLDAFRTIILEPLVRRKKHVTETLRRENDTGKALALQKEIIDLNATIRKTSSDLGIMINGILEGR